MTDQSYLCQYHPTLSYSQRCSAILMATMSRPELESGFLKPCIARAALGLREMRGQS